MGNQFLLLHTDWNQSSLKKHLATGRNRATIGKQGVFSPKNKFQAAGLVIEDSLVTS
jgi:hypothetical protein